MTHEATARSVSGEKMTGPRGEAPGPYTRYEAAGGQWTDAEVIDADYVEVVPAGERAFVRRQAPARIDAVIPAGLAFLRRGIEATTRTPRHAGPLFWLTGAVAVLAAFWIAGGHATLRPGFAGTPLPDLQIGNVTSRTQTIEGEVALLVDGDISNTGRSAGKVPPLAVTVLSQDGAKSIYRLGTLRTPLAPGAKYSFSGRLDMPKDGVKTVSVAFDQ